MLHLKFSNRIDRLTTSTFRLDNKYVNIKLTGMRRLQAHTVLNPTITVGVPWRNETFYHQVL